MPADPSPPQLAPRLAEILDADALRRLAQAMGSHGPMVYLGAVGLRWGEIAGLRVGRLDFLRHTVAIDRQLTRGLHGRMIESHPKTQAGRRPALALPEWIMAMFAEVLASRGITAGDPDARLFISPDGGPLPYSNWRVRVWLPARAAAGLPSLNFHDLKHTAGTALVDEGINIKTAQARARPRQPQGDAGVLRPGDRPSRPGGLRPAGRAFSPAGWTRDGSSTSEVPVRPRTSFGVRKATPTATAPVSSCTTPAQTGETATGRCGLRLVPAKTAVPAVPPGPASRTTPLCSLDQRRNNLPIQRTMLSGRRG